MSSSSGRHSNPDFQWSRMPSDAGRLIKTNAGFLRILLSTVRSFSYPFNDDINLFRQWLTKFRLAVFQLNTPVIIHLRLLIYIYISCISRFNVHVLLIYYGTTFSWLSVVGLYMYVQQKISINSSWRWPRNQDLHRHRGYVRFFHMTLELHVQ